MAHWWDATALMRPSSPALARPAKAAHDADDDKPDRSLLTALRERVVPAFRAVDDTVRGAADTISFGMADEFAAKLGELTGIGSAGGDYDANLKAERSRDDAGGVARLAGQLAGTIALAGIVGPYAPSSRAIMTSGSSIKAAGLSALEGGLLSAIYAAGSGIEDRYSQMLMPSAQGILFGLGSPYLAAGVQKGAAPIVDYLRRWRHPQAAADLALSKVLAASGRTGSDVVSTLEAAGRDGQGNLIVADALGEAGRDKLITLAQSSGSIHQTIAGALMGRQTAQGQRLGTYVADALDAPQTAGEYVANMRAARQTAPDAHVTFADGKTSAAGSTNAHDFAGTTATRTPERMPDSIEEAMAHAQASDVYLRQSRAIDAVEIGQNAASSKTRARDNLAAFRNLSPDEQAAFRVGYADRTLGGMEAAPVSSMTNKVPFLRSEKASQELPAFATPGKADLLQRRLDREQLMFDTTDAFFNSRKPGMRPVYDAERHVSPRQVFGALVQGDYGDAAI